MRFVHDRVVACRNHLAERALPHGGVRAQEMMVDDDHVRFGGALAHLRDETFVVPFALGAEARVRGRRDVVPERHVLRQILQLRAIAGFSLRRPLADDRQEDVVCGGTDAVVDLIETMETEVIRATFHIGRRKRDAERLPQRGNVFEEDLLLEILGAG